MREKCLKILLSFFGLIRTNHVATCEFNNDFLIDMSSMNNDS